MVESRTMVAVQGGVGNAKAGRASWASSFPHLSVSVGELIQCVGPNSGCSVSILRSSYVCKT